jgi:hypothetical protein
MALHRLTALALTAVLALGVSACGEDTPPQTAPSTSSAASSPSPAATGPVAPVLPELAKRQDEVGAKAFVKYWFAAVTYAMKTGDPSAFVDVSHPKCETCSALAEHITDLEADGSSLEGGGWRVLGVQHDPKTEAPYWRFAVKVAQSKQRVRDANAKVIDASPRQIFFFYVGVTWDEEFRLRGVERVDD